MPGSQQKGGNINSQTNKYKYKIVYEGMEVKKNITVTLSFLRRLPIFTHAVSPSVSQTLAIYLFTRLHFFHPDAICIKVVFNEFLWDFI